MGVISTITITVNGQERALEGPVPLTDFLRDLGVRATFMAVARNGEVLRKEEHAGVTIRDGDVLELVRPVGGGARCGTRCSSGPNMAAGGPEDVCLRSKS